MIILRNFHFKNGKIDQIEEITDKHINDIAKVVSYKNNVFEWLYYDYLGWDNVDYELVYEQIVPEKAHLYQIQEIIKENDTISCDCGGLKTGGSHSHWCSSLNP